MKVRWSHWFTKQRAEAIAEMRLERIRKLSRLAHIDPDYEPHARNAWLAYQDGKPWPGIDYKLIRQILWMRDHLYDASRVMQRYCKRRDAENRFWIEPNQGKFA